MALVAQPQQQVAALGTMLVRPAAQTGWVLVTLPTGQQANRTFVQSLCINDEERTVAAMPSADVDVALRATVDLREWCAKLIRREGYFRAMLI